MNTAAELLDELQAAIRATQKATEAVLALARTQAAQAEAKAADDDEWTRMPTGKNRCKVSGWSRSTLIRRIHEKAIRGKSVLGSAYYSAADVRRYLKQ